MQNGHSLQRDLRVLAHLHDVVRDAPLYVPLSAPSSDPVLSFEGYASTSHVDCDRVRFSSRCFGTILPSGLPLLIEHDATKVAGTVEELSYDLFGALKVRATVTHERGKRCGAFSVSARVHAYTIHDADRPRFYAEVTQATLVEVSLTEFPRNSKALVQSRTKAAPHIEFHEQFKARVARMTEMTRELQQRLGAL